MNCKGTNSIALESRDLRGLGSTAPLIARSSSDTMLVAVPYFARAGGGQPALPGVGIGWTMVSTAGGGTSRAVAKPVNYYHPKTSLGRRLLALRNAAIAEGMPLVPVAKIVADVDDFRG